LNHFGYFISKSLTEVLSRSPPDFSGRLGLWAVQRARTILLLECTVSLILCGFRRCTVYCAHFII